MKKAGSDLPWLIGSIAVTIPTCAYLLQPSSDSQGHHGADAHHTKEEAGNQNVSEQSDDVSDDEGKRDLGPSTRGDVDDESEKGNKGEAQEEGKGGDEGDDKGEDKAGGEGGDKDGSGEQQDDAQDGDESGGRPGEREKETPEHKGEPSGVQFKGRTNQGEDNKADDTRKRIPDAKGGNKKRIESSYGNELGKAENPEREDAVGKAKDKAQASKEPLDKNHTSGKQAGLSNTSTKHSTDITKDPNKSKKGEGAPETAKLQGPVDPSRPSAESNDRDDPEKA